MIRLGNHNSSHLFELWIKGGGIKFKIEVEANNRAQARAIAERVGYIVDSVNMVG